MDREVRISPDGMMVAVRSNSAEDAWDAWGVMHCLYGGHWSATSELVGWSVVTAVEALPIPEPLPAGNANVPPGAETP